MSDKVTKCELCGVSYGRQKQAFCTQHTLHRWVTVQAVQNNHHDALATENKRLREALVGIKAEVDNQNPTHETIWRIAYEALKGDTNE